MTQKFHERFGIKIDLREARKRFVNRASNIVFDSLEADEEIENKIATALGERSGADIEDYILGDFHKTLQVLEIVYDAVDDYTKPELGQTIQRILSESEFDLGVRWTNGHFIPSGAKLLDEKLVNESLRWLSDKKYESVLTPFSKALDHFLHVQKRPDLLSDVITDMYEGLEALAKIVTGKDRDLSANAELFIKKLGASDSYKRILKDYISYASDFRHAVQEGKEKPKLSIPEVESFIYLTGLFIRLAIQMESTP